MLKLGYSDEYGRVVYRCPEPQCFYARQVPRADLPPEHKCPQINGTTKVGWTVYGPSLLEQTWAELDFYTARIIEDGQKEYDKGYARGLAKTLSLFMVPHFSTPDDIVKEAHKRYKMKQSGEEYCTPGLAERKYEPPPGDHKLSRQTEQRAKVTNKPKAVEPALTTEQIAGIKNALGMFSPKELADMYKVSVATVEALA